MKQAAARLGRAAIAASRWHGREIEPSRHVLDQFFLWDLLLHLKASVLHATDVAVDDTGVVFLADYLVALRMTDRVFHLHAFQRLDHAFDILAGLIAGHLDRLF